MATTFDFAALKAHVGRRETSTDVVTPVPANLLRLTLDRPEPEFREGDPLPPGWHALYFLPRFGPRALRPDGSPGESGVIPAMPLPRRMFAGERVRFHRPLRIGEAVRRETELADITVKSGSTGTLVFATVVHRISGADGLAVEEERRTVFREEVPPGARNQAPRREEPPADTPWRRRVVPDPVLLFRFSALTFNSHRIHYDRPWATEVERYPGLLVHGPLTSTLLIDFARDHAAGRTLTSWTTQARAPLFDTAPFELRGRPVADGASAGADGASAGADGASAGADGASAGADGGCEVWAVTPEGTIAMSAQAGLA